MNRRDIIIIAVLVNAGLLAILFMMAITSDNEKLSELSEASSQLVEIPLTDISQQESSASKSTSSVPKQPTDTIPEFGLDCPEDDEENTESAETPVQTPKPEPTAEPIPQPPVQEEPVVTPPKKTTTKIVEITVKKGDSLDKIARANGTTILAIKKASNLKSDRLSIGQVLQVPVTTEKKPTTKASKPKTEIAAADTSTGPKYHTIKSGDNPWKIAKKYHIKVDDLLKMNSLDEDKARSMKIGDKIRVQ